MNLQGNFKEDKHRFVNIKEFDDVAKFVKRFFKIQDVDEQEIAKIVGILQVNIPKYQ